MKLPVSSLLLFYFTVLIHQSHCREITHEDIKDAMLSLVHMMRENTEKLERHEVRERQLGDQMKKAISLLSKRVSAVDGIKTHLNKLDERITGIEQLISQRDERERIQMQKTSDTIELLEQRLDSWLNELENKVTKINRPVDTEKPNVNEDKSTEIMAKLYRTEAAIGVQVARLELVLDAVSSKFQENSADVEKLRALSAEITSVGHKIGDMEDTLKALKESTEKLPAEVKEQISANSPSFEEQAWEMNKVQELLKNISHHLEQIPMINEVTTLHNETQAALQETKHTLENTIIREIAGVGERVQETREVAKESIGELRLDLANNAERVNQELHDLNKGQSVVVSMADHVLDTKKRVEYGVHQILLEVGDLIKAQGLGINSTLNSRFDEIFKNIMDNQNGALANLTSKMEQEMNQVWRQINVMYQQMSESAKALDKIHKQNEAYVNGTTTSMDGMESKVGEITKRMSEMDENLNYLLGRLSLVMQEFNQIKTGLGAALDNIKSSFKEVQKQADDLSNPGPHPVPENHKEIGGEEAHIPEIISHIKSH